MKQKEKAIAERMNALSQRKDAPAPHSDIVISAAPVKKSRADGRSKAYPVWLRTEDQEKIDDLNFWLQGQRIKSNYSRIFRAGLSLLGKDEQTVETLRKIIEKETVKL
ncbi:MAG: hypothetical protein PHV34_19205 [Verrucomicrobiae bacterium]|nr:hypothetical protein [Verrucomicrobiae bacterium]